jgi:hypothetical protein
MATTLAHTSALGAALSARRSAAPNSATLRTGAPIKARAPRNTTVKAGIVLAGNSGTQP